MTIKTAFPREQYSVLKKLLFTLASNALNAKIILTLRPKGAETAMVAVTSIKIQTLAQCLKLQFQTLTLGKTRLSYLMINPWTTLTKTTKNSKTQIKSPSAQATSPTSTIMSAYLALKELCFPWRKRLVELAKAILSSTKLPITAKRNLSTPTCKIPTGQARKLTLKSKRKSMKRPKTRFIQNVLSKSLSQLESNAFNVAETNTLTTINKNATNATTVKFSIKTCTHALTVKATSKQTQKKLPAWFLKADPKTNGCTFTTRTFSKTQVCRTARNKSLTLMEWAALCVHLNILTST